jgi:hypothetical protein
MTRATLGRPSSVARCLRSSFIPVSVVAPSRPKTGLRQATPAHRNKPGRRPHTEIPAWRGTQASSLCVTQAHAVATGNPCPARIGTTFRCSRHTHEAGSVMPEKLDTPWAVHASERRARLHHLRWGARTDRHGMMASTVFFSAVGWAGDLGAFSRARSSLAPSSCSCAMPTAARRSDDRSRAQHEPRRDSQCRIRRAARHDRRSRPARRRSACRPLGNCTGCAG